MTCQKCLPIWWISLATFTLHPALLFGGFHCLFFSAGHGGAKVKNNDAVAVARKKMMLIRAISAPFLNQILLRKLNKLLILQTIKNT